VVVSSSIIKEKDDIPEYCRVTGYVLRSAYFEVRLPTSSWNGKFYMGGCGGLCGKVMDRPGFTNAMNYGLTRKYAVSTTDWATMVKRCGTASGRTTTGRKKSISDIGPPTRLPGRASRSSRDITAKHLFMRTSPAVPTEAVKRSWRP